MKTLFFYSLVLTTVFLSCKKEETKQTPSPTPTPNPIEECTVYGTNIPNSKITYQWKYDGINITPRSEECAVNVQYNLNSSGWVNKRVDYQWEFARFIIMLPEDSTTLTNIDIANKQSIINYHYWNSFDTVTQMEIGKYIDIQVEDNVGIKWVIPYDTTYNPPTYFNRINTLQYVQTKANEVVWKISGDFFLQVRKNQSVEVEDVSGSYQLYYLTNRM